jgi:hypothetical protein
MLTLPEPPLPERDNLDFAWMSFNNGILVAELNSMALANFRWSLWLMATKLPRGEDIDIWSSQPMLPSETSGAPIGYCEITLTGEGPVGGRLHNPNAELLHREDRVDLFVNRMQAEKAYQDLESLSGNEIGRSVTLFGKLTIKVVETKGGQTYA